MLSVYYGNPRLQLLLVSLARLLRGRLRPTAALLQPHLLVAATLRRRLAHLSDIPVFLDVGLAGVHDALEELARLSPLDLLGVGVETLPHGRQPILIDLERRGHRRHRRRVLVVLLLLLLLLLRDQRQLVLVRARDNRGGDFGEGLRPVLLDDRLELGLSDGGGRVVVFAGRGGEALQVWLLLLQGPRVIAQVARAVGAEIPHSIAG